MILHVCGGSERVGHTRRVPSAYSHLDMRDGQVVVPTTFVTNFQLYVFADPPSSPPNSGGDTNKTKIYFSVHWRAGGMGAAQGRQGGSAGERVIYARRCCEGMQ